MVASVARKLPELDLRDPLIPPFAQSGQGMGTLQPMTVGRWRRLLTRMVH